MKWDTFKTVLQVAFIIPVIGILAYVGFWFSLIMGPLVIGIIIVTVAFYLYTDYKESKKLDEVDEHELMFK